MVVNSAEQSIRSRDFCQQKMPAEFALIRTSTKPDPAVFPLAKTSREDIQDTYWPSYRPAHIDFRDCQVVAVPERPQEWSEFILLNMKPLRECHIWRLTLTPTEVVRPLQDVPDTFLAFEFSI